MQKPSLQLYALQLLAMLVLLAITTAINHSIFNSLGITGVTLLYLLVVVVAAYFCEFLVASLSAFLAFLTINYFFIEPRYTFEVAHVESWVSLICFLIVSIVITSLVKQLKFQTLQAAIATKHAQFGRTLAENLALASNVESLLQDTCQLLRTEFDKPFAIALYDKNNAYSLTNNTIEMPDTGLLNWAAENGKPISPYTDYWSKSAHWLLPFNRLPINRLHGLDSNRDPILVVGNIGEDDSVETFSTIKSCVDQISLAYQRLITIEKTKQAEFSAQEEALQNALLASISHDMRTPLTSILGAATTLQQPNLDAAQAAHLSTLIASQARYLATTTDNILSLVRLESSTQISMDWQSPEEIIGAVIALYKNRDETIDLKVTINEPELLIKGNASLLMQALINLIDNAQRANVNQNPIDIEVSKTDNRINISVNDRGSGFSDNFDASHIKKFSTDSAKGLGLGLSIVQAIAKSHDAILTIHNREGGGVCATLRFNAPNIENIDA
jgi:two-component system, OmpR family, sensor histidine kinase KdpD